MENFKARVWDKVCKCYPENYKIFFNGAVSIEDTWASNDSIIELYSGLPDSKGTDIYAGDVVYLAGYGLYECEFLFTLLYEASTEGDIGEIKGNIHLNPELLK